MDWARAWEQMPGAVVGAVVGAVLGVALTAALDPRGDAEPLATALNITSHSSNGPTETVPDLVRLEGNVSHLRPGQTLWAFDTKADRTNYYPHDGPCAVDQDAEGEAKRWTCPAFGIGRSKDVGEEFTLIVSAVDDGFVQDLVKRQSRRAVGEFEPLPGDVPGIKKSVNVRKGSG